MYRCSSSILPWLVLVLTLALEGCGRGTACERCFSAVFSGFSYVDSYPTTARNEAGLIGPKPFPHSFEPGRTYVFEPNGPVTTEATAIATLPSRLRECGATSITAPRSPNDLAPVSLGGPVWEIRFVLGNCRGRITNRINPGLRDSRRGWPTGSFTLPVPVSAKRSMAFFAWRAFRFSSAAISSSDSSLRSICFTP